MFNGKADFGLVRIEGNAQFTDVNLYNTKDMGLDFYRAVIVGTADFSRVYAEGEVSFQSSRIEGTTYFVDSEFRGKVNFEDASFSTLVLSFDESVNEKEIILPFERNICLRGFTYTRLYPTTAWKKLMKMMDSYDRQPYTHLEETFRKSGKDTLANNVYYERRKIETKQRMIFSPKWLLDQFLRWSTGYGVRLWQLIIVISLILAIGTFVFLNEGSVDPKDEYKEALVAENKTDSKVNVGEALGVSINAFLPVDIDTITPWQPSSNRWVFKFTTWAGILSVTGWIIVPTALAGLSGLLKR